MVELVDKTFDILERVARAAPCSLRDLSEGCGVPLSTAHRIVATLVRRGYLVAERKGRYRLGMRWRDVAAGCTLPALLQEVGRRPLADLARAAQAHAHLARLEGEMVTYLVKQRYGRVAIHSMEDMQLEAYCTAIGKVLLAHLAPDALAAYLDGGPFVRLTPATVTEPDAIRVQLAEARARGWATEIEETSPRLMCLAVPILDPAGEALAAISVSVVDPRPTRAALLDRLPSLLAAKRRIEDKLFPDGRRAAQPAL